MCDRSSLIVVVFCTGLLALTGSMAAQDQMHLTAEELYQHAIQLYADGQYEAALEVFDRVDQMQLPKQQRQTMQEMLKDIRQLLHEEPSDPGALLEQADHARDRGRNTDAMTLYQSVLSHPSATGYHKRLATARIAELRRTLSAELTRVRQSIDAADADLKAGRIDAAQDKLLAVTHSGVELGWFDRGRVNRLLALVAERRVAQPQLALAEPPAAAEAAAEAPAPAEPAPEPPRKKPKRTKKDEPARSDVLVQARRLYVQEQLARGRAEEQAGNYRLAVKYYEKAVAFEPQNREALAALTAARAKADDQQAPRGVLDEQMQSLTIHREAAQAEFNDLMTRAIHRRDAGDYTAALELTQ
ncbi:MAG: hypothetical protein V3U29_06020, partial [Phycisphaeraceae bacterium]